MAPKLNVKIESLSYADIDACAEISRRDGYDMHRMARRGYLGNPERKTMVLVKAVDVDVGSIVGYGGCAFPNVKQASIPWIGPADAKPQEQGPKSEAGDKVTREPGQTLKPDAIERPHALEDKDMQYFQYKVIPAGEPCITVMGLAVAPAHQSPGVGSALLGNGNTIADRLRLTIWAHSSHQAVDAYGKAGFEPVRVLHLDLDEYEPRPLGDNEPVMGNKRSGKWGHYVIQYMKREPGEVNTETM
ncbi:hypothetical protein G3M48_001020 [Beauveria asiatica]|uniref:N-acetyltransferase domain-containing protein n=1 Tax=Beauveria asiatica TaxID=1069075 RepID=A0AAW0RFT7_9HYPO